MDVNKIKAAIKAGILYREIDTDLNNLYMDGVITKDEFDSLARQIEDLENAEIVSRINNNDLTIEQASYAREENSMSEEENSVTALNNVAEAVNEPVVPVAENEAPSSNTEERAEDPQQEPQSAPENSASEDTESREDSNKDAPQWVSDYRNYMMEWSARNPERRLEKFEKDENSYRADFKDGVAINFSSPSNVAIKTADPESPKASDFDALIEIAKKSNQNIRLSENMSDEFRKALIEACAISDVKITNLSKEDAELYLSFVAPEEENTKEQQDVVNDAEENVAAPVNEGPVNEEPKAPAEEAEPVAESESPVVENTSEEAIPMPASLSETAQDDEQPFDLEYHPEETREEHSFELNYNPEETEENDSTDHLFDNLEMETPEEPVVEEPKAESENNETPAQPSAETAPVNEIAAEEEGFFKRVFKKAKNKLPVWMVGLGSAGAVVAPSCNTPTQRQSQTTDGYESFMDNSAETSDTTYVATAADFQETAADSVSTAVPTEWNENMGISERDYNIVRKACGSSWETMYTNAHLLKDQLSTQENQMTEAQILLATRNIVAWTTSPNAKGKAKLNSGILASYGLENLVNALRCGDTLTVENITNYQIMLAAGNNDRLNVNVNTLAGLNARFANLPHDAEGYLIGNTCNQFKAIGDCGEKAQFKMGNCGQNVTQRVEKVIVEDTPAPVVEQDTTTYVAPEPVAVIDTVQEAPAPEVKKAKAPQAPKFVTVASTSNLGEAPMNGFMSTVSEGANESHITKGTKGATKRMARQLKRSGIDAKTAEEFSNEVKSPNSSKAEAQEKAKQQQQNYEWTVNNQNSRD